MHVLKRNPWLFGLGALLAVLVVHGRAVRADVTTDRPGAVVIFPKVISDGTRDTLIQLTNTDNLALDSIECVYVNALGICSGGGAIPPGTCNLDTDCPDAQVCVHQCLEHNFNIGGLTMQQPTGWRVSTGRDFTDLTSGMPIKVPAQGTLFAGELKCFVLDASGAPVARNKLKGEATLINVDTGDISIYNGISVQATTAGTCTPDPSSGVPICEFPLDAVHYNACPADLVVNHLAEGFVEPLTGATVSTELTLIPCTEDLENQLSVRGLATLFIYNEFETKSSIGLSFDCWFNRRLADIGTNFGPVLGTEFLMTRVVPPATATLTCLSGDRINLPCATNTDCPNAFVTPSGTILGCRPFAGLLGVAEQFQETGGVAPLVGSDAYNVHMEGTRPGDLLVLPIGPGNLP